QHILPGLAAIAMLAFTHLAYVDHKGNWTKLAKTIHDQSTVSEPVVIVGSGKDNLWLDRTCVGLLHYYPGPPPAVIIANHTIAPAVESSLRRWPSLWLIRDTT